MTILELLAMGGFGFSIAGKIGLWYKKTWGWAVTSVGSLCWLIWGLMIAFTKPGSGGWFVLSNDITVLIVGIVGWIIWRRAEKES